MKVSVIGAGNVGATAADVMASRSICSEIVLLDISRNQKFLKIYLSLFDSRLILKIMSLFIIPISLHKD